MLNESRKVDQPVRYVLDTSALLAHFRQEAGWQVVQALFEDNEADLIIASLTLTEFGRRLRDLGFSEEDVESVFSAYQLLFREIVAIDVVVARAAFALGCQTPHRLPLADALIAAVAVMKNAMLVHRDQHMRSIPKEQVQQQDLVVSSV